MKMKNLQGKQPGTLGRLGHKTSRITGEIPHHNTAWRNVQLQEGVKQGQEFKMWECPTMEHSDHSAHHPKKQSEQWYSNKSPNFAEKTLFLPGNCSPLIRKILLTAKGQGFDILRLYFAVRSRWFLVLPSWGDFPCITSKSPCGFKSSHIPWHPKPTFLRCVRMFQLEGLELPGSLHLPFANCFWHHHKNKNLPLSTHCTWYLPKEQKYLKIFNKIIVKSTVQRRIWNKKTK